MAQPTRRPRRQIRAKVYELNGLEALGNKASRGQWRWCLAQDSAGMDGLKRERKEQPLRERADPQLVRRAQPTAGRQRAVGLQSNKQRTIIIRVDPQTQITQQDSRDASQSSTEALTVQTIAQRSEAQQSQFIEETMEIPASALDSEDRGNSSITVQ